MKKQEILSKINVIFRDILDNEKLKISEDTTASEVPEWDSLTHIQLVVAIEKYFKIRFTSSELQKFKNVGQMCDSILKKLQ